MSNVTYERASEVIRYAYTHGDGKALSKFGVNVETLSRYKRKLKAPSGAKILVFDIENAPTTAYVWNRRMWNTTINAGQLKEDWYMICWAAKWLNDSKIINACVTSEESRERDDTRIVNKLWYLFDQADIIIAHNGLGFDIPMVNTRFLFHRLNRPSPYKVIDTLKVAQKGFSVTFNSLNYLSKFLGLGQKDDTDFQLWIDCMAGNKKELKRMQQYNNQDVGLLEDVYYELRGWIRSHPNLNKYQGTKDCCSNCGSSNIEKNGHYTTATNIFDSFKCRDCGAFSRQASKVLISTAH